MIVVAIVIGLAAGMTLAAIGSVFIARGIRRSSSEAKRQARAQIAEWDATTQKYVQDPLRRLGERDKALLRDLHKEGAE